MMQVRVPKSDGLIRVIVVNLLLWLGFVVTAYFQRDHLIGALVAIGASIIFISLGPALLFANVLVWKCARLLAYFSALILSFFLISSVINEGLLGAPWYTVTLLILIIYLIGLRGFLNTDSMRLHFGIESIDEGAGS